MDLSEDQKEIHDAIIDDIKTKRPLITLGGYAGTGKTTLISKIKETLEKDNPRIKIAFVTFTGKASLVLSQKIGFIDDRHYCGTIHGLIYVPESHWNSKLNRMVITKWVLVPEIDYDFIIIDEASMVSKEIFEDLLSFNINILAVGDHGQLPPISSSHFNLMLKPNYKLEKIHRQAENNPIIKLSQMARNRETIPFGIFSPGIVKLPREDKRTWNLFNNIQWGEDTISLCALNSSRVKINDLIRKNMGFKDKELYPGERLLCLKNNRYSKIYNGQLGMLMLMNYEATDILEVCIQMDSQEEIYNGLIDKNIFGKEIYDDVFNVSKDKYKRIQSIIKNTIFKDIDYFDWGYCMSVHKSQGSQWKRVVLFEERSYYWDERYYAKWLYTGITRASERLMLISYD